ERGVGVRKVLADVAKSDRAEQRVTQGMQQHVAVGVRHQAETVWDTHAAKGDEVALAKAMNVVTMTDTHKETPREKSGRDSTAGGHPANLSCPAHQSSSSSKDRCRAK